MIGWIVGLIAPTVGEKAAKPVAYALLAIGVILLLWGGKCAYDASVVNNYKTKVEASAAKADRKADQKAADQAATDLARRQYETDQLTEAMRNAPKDPTVPDDRERALAFHKCLGLQQRARDNGLEPPRCV